MNDEWTNKVTREKFGTYSPTEGTVCKQCGASYGEHSGLSCKCPLCGEFLDGVDYFPHPACMDREQAEADADPN